MNMRNVRDEIAQKLAKLDSVRRVYVRLGNPPRVVVNLDATATSTDDEAVRIALGPLYKNYKIDIVHSGHEHITFDSRISPKIGSCLS